MCRFLHSTSVSPNACTAMPLHCWWSRKLRRERPMQRSAGKYSCTESRDVVQRRSDSGSFCELTTAWRSDLNARVRLLVGSAVKHRHAV